MLSKVGVFIIIFSFIIGGLSQTTVTYSNLQAFFENTYDTNHDGFATLQEFQKYFAFMEPEHNITKQTTTNIFSLFDYDRDSKVTLKEIIKFGQLKITYHAGHKQIHIGLTENEGEMQIMWVSNPQSYRKPVVYFSQYPTSLKKQYVQAQISTYNVGHIGFHGKIYRAVIKNLIPSKRYYYQVGDLETETFSQVKYFKGPPKRNAHIDQQIKIAVFGDMGTFAPLGNTVIRQIGLDNFVKPFDFVFLTGDIAYAGMNSQKTGQVQPIWDLFGQLTQKFAAYSPFMPGVGNHEKYYNYSSYFHRYRLPRLTQNQTNLWFSFDYGQVHMVHFSSQHPYTEGSPQYQFLRNDLEKASKNPNTKWIILGVHRAFYSSDKTQYHEITPLAAVLEQMVNKYHVDIVQTGHLHSYQRSWPVYKGKAIKQGHTETLFMNPKAPIYVVQGTAGALINQKWISPSPEWSIKRILRYGYGKIQIKGNVLKYQYINAPGGKVLDEWSIVKTGAQKSDIEFEI